MNKQIKKVLTIAGSDCSGGAGIQADLKTICAHGMYGMSVITALTAQNTMGVKGIKNIDREFVELQLESIFDDITPDAIKIGMVSEIETINCIAENLRKYKPNNIVVDTVMVSTSGHDLLNKEAVTCLKEQLISLADIITPNIAEAEVLSGIKISNKEDMCKAAKIISNITDADILIKGGHLSDCSDDLLLSDNKEIWFEGVHIDNPNTHGTGCTLSSAIACGLAGGENIENSVKAAKDYITAAIEYGLDIGKGRGPLNHMYRL